MASADVGPTTIASRTLPDRARTHHGQTARLLAQLEACLNDSGPVLALEARRVAELAERLNTGRFHLAVLGQFKRGKSSLLNALLGEALLPTSVVPLTAAPTFIRWSEEATVRVIREDDRAPEEFTGNSTEERTAFLHHYVTEEGNPKNCLGVTEVEVLLPSPLLAEGVVLIDTPGIGSTYRHNTEATLNFLPQCDAALFLVSADPPLTEVEVGFLREVRERVPKLFFVLNKIDYLDAEERVVTLRFLRKTLCEQLGISEQSPIFPVSACFGLQARLTEDSELWRDSGLAELETHLVRFLVTEKVAALEEAVRRKARDVAESALMHFRLRIRSLELPQAELDQRLAAFDVALEQASRERLVAQDLLDGDKRRTVEYLEDLAEGVRRESRLALEEVLRESPAISHSGSMDETAAEEVLAGAIPAFFEKKLGEMARRMDERVALVLRPHQDRADDLAEKVRRSAAELFEIPYHPLDSTHAFEFKSQPYWVTHKWDSTFSPMPKNWLDLVLPGTLRRKRAAQRISEKINALVIHNVENLRWAALQNLNLAFMRFATALDECLDETISATKGAILAACEKREQQADVLADESSRITAKAVELENLRSDMMSAVSILERVEIAEDR